MTKGASLATNLFPFLSKVTLNQILLGPIVVAGVFSYTALLDSTTGQLAGKMQRDMLPTLQAGWKFWIPAASLNFTVVPLQYQVLFMSACGVVWNAILSAASS